MYNDWKYPKAEVMKSRTKIFMKSRNSNLKVIKTVTQQVQSLINSEVKIKTHLFSKVEVGSPKPTSSSKKMFITLEKPPSTGTMQA